jgi:hypothetical protein
MGWRRTTCGVFYLEDATFAIDAHEHDHEHERENEEYEHEYEYEHEHQHEPRVAALRSPL